VSAAEKRILEKETVIQPWHLVSQTPPAERVAW
jgi:hypothetical protein